MFVAVSFLRADHGIAFMGYSLEWAIHSGRTGTPLVSDVHRNALHELAARRQLLLWPRKHVPF